MDSPNNYDARRAAQNQEYKDEFARWIEGMSADERAKAEALGVAAPHIDAQGVGAPELDADRLADTYEQDFDFDEPAQDEETIKRAVARQVNRQVRRVIVELLEAKNARLTVECLSLVTGVGYLGVSETSISKKFNVTRAAVSKRCVELCDKLGLPPARAMKSTDARASYRRSRHAAYAAEG